MQMKSARCWCGRTETRLMFNGPWASPAGSALAYLGQCVGCGTVRTEYVDADVDPPGSPSEVPGFPGAHIVRTVTHFGRPGSLLDAAGRSGQFLAEMAPHAALFPRRVGVDETAAAGRPVVADLDLRRCALETLDESFDTLVSLHHLQTVADLSGLFSSLRRLIKPGGTMVLAVPNIASRACRTDLAAWGLLEPRRNIWHFSRETLARALAHFLPGGAVLATLDSDLASPPIHIDQTITINDLKNILYSDYQGEQIEAVVSL